jgi:mono/diheme cytochrome c family protein
MKMASSRINRFHAVILIVLALGLALWSKPATAEDAASTYKAKCSACHGADGKGDTAMGKKFGLRDLASPEMQKLSDDELNAIIADGKDKMPSYKKSLKPEQIKDLVGFIRSLAKK